MLPLLLALTSPAEAGVIVVRPGRRPPPPPRRPPPAQVDAPAPVKSITISVSAVDVTQGMGSASLEFRIDPQNSLSLGAGLGMNDEGLLYKGGLEARHYMVGDFKTGLYLGLGVEGGNQHLFLPREDAFMVGPTAGAKLTFPGVPLTLQGGVGVDLLLGDGYAAVAPSLDVGLGFTF